MPYVKADEYRRMTELSDEAKREERQRFHEIFMYYLERYQEKKMCINNDYVNDCFEQENNAAEDADRCIKLQRRYTR